MADVYQALTRVKGGEGSGVSCSHISHPVPAVGHGCANEVEQCCRVLSSVERQTAPLGRQQVHRSSNHPQCSLFPLWRGSRTGAVCIFARTTHLCTHTHVLAHTHTHRAQSSFAKEGSVTSDSSFDFLKRILSTLYEALINTIIILYVDNKSNKLTFRCGNTCLSKLQI